MPVSGSLGGKIPAPTPPLPPSWNRALRLPGSRCLEVLGCCQEGPGRAMPALETEQPQDRDARGRKFRKHLSSEHNSTQPCSRSPHPCRAGPAFAAFREEEALHQAVGYSQEAGEPGCSCPGGGHVQTQRRRGKGENT